MSDQSEQRVTRILEGIRRLAGDPEAMQKIVEIMAPLYPNAGLTHRAIMADERLRERLRAKGCVNFNVSWSDEPITVDEAVKACHDLLDAVEHGDFTPIDPAELDCPKTDVRDFVASLPER